MNLEGRVAALERRIAALEAATRPGHSSGAVAEGPNWAIRRLTADFAEAEVVNGGILFAGSGHLPAGDGYGWQMSFSTDDLLLDDADSAAECLAALGSPVRLRLLRAILYGRRTAAELAELDGVGTSGQIYHHLRQLAAVGWLQTAGRGRFEVPPGRVVPLLVALASARR
ncbi:winged helix-turn-helix domain-containing protein [Nocardia arizonensis]|uniref:winged helix-turn-helix domain-containing protein n=1 Tax=Nocardia arizonensis TaxID=1141647 RepID=UPI0006D25C32|nr:winged helix-turn-helix domain-containing protein [Nocardia arizonensis]